MSLIDYLFLYSQIILLSILIIKEILKNKDRNLYIILVSLTFLVLVQFQSIWIFSKLRNSSQLIHMFQVISVEGASLANIYMFFGVIVFLSTVIALSRSKFKKNNRHNSEYTSIYLTDKSPSILTYIIVSTSLLILSIALIILLGGLATALSNPGQAVAGQTMILILIGIAKYPLATKLVSNQKIALIDISLYLIAIFANLINSRFLAAAYIIQLLFILNYCRKEISRKNIINTIASMVFIFIIFGVYREYGNFRPDDQYFDLGDFLEFSSTRFSDNNGLLDWFYGFGVESFAGLAGIVSFDIKRNGINHDFGVSELSFITQLIPNQLRNDPTLPFVHIADFIKSSYPYPDASIVKPGYENVYAHFGILGVPMLSYLIGFLTYKLNEFMLNKSKSRKTKLLISLLSVYLLMLIQNSISAVLFFGIGEAFMFKVYMLLLDNTGTNNSPIHQNM